jgi:hypothetical protein
MFHDDLYDYAYDFNSSAGQSTMTPRMLRPPSQHTFVRATRPDHVYVGLSRCSNVYACTNRMSRRVPLDILASVSIPGFN